MKTRALLGVVLGACAAACAAGGDSASGGTGGAGAAGGAGPGGAGGSGGAATTTTSTGDMDGGLFDATPVGEPGEVYGHSDRTLFKLEPITKEVTTIGNFDCVTPALPGSGEGMWDIALDKAGNMVGSFVVYQGIQEVRGLVQIDTANAHCSIIANTAERINSLTYVPEGTLEADKEVLVGYNGASYVRLDPGTGAVTPIGNMNPNPTGQDWEASGDVVSIINDKTYVTVKPLGSGSGFAGSDHIVEVSPVTGQVVTLIGDTTYPKLWGLGYWGGTAYGFSATGQLCAIDLTNGASTGIPLMGIPAGLSFWGAGVTTAAPTQPPE